MRSSTQTGIRARVISGTEEARLIHLAAAYGLGLSGEVAVVIDIGGGSVEITRGTGPAIDLGRSFKVGVIRLTERFVKSDPISSRDERKLVKHIESELDEYLRKITDAGFDRVVGTSGTILSLGAIAHRRTATAPRAVRNRRISAKQIHRVRKQLTSLNLEKRLEVPGLDPRRADLAVAGAILLDTILRRLDAPDISLCDLSLREGLILDYIAQAPQGNRAGRPLSRCAAPQRDRAGGTLQLLAGSRASDRAARAGALRSDARHPRHDRQGARVARISRPSCTMPASTSATNVITGIPTI